MGQAALEASCEFKEATGSFKQANDTYLRKSVAPLCPQPGAHVKGMLSVECDMAVGAITRLAMAEALTGVLLTSSAYTMSTAKPEAADVPGLLVEVMRSPTRPDDRANTLRFAYCMRLRDAKFARAVRVALNMESKGDGHARLLLYFTKALALRGETLADDGASLRITEWTVESTAFLGSSRCSPRGVRIQPSAQPRLPTSTHAGELAPRSGYEKLVIQL